MNVTKSPSWQLTGVSIFCILSKDGNSLKRYLFFGSKKSSFLFNGAYDQFDRVTLGSLLVPIFSIAYMAAFETNHLTSIRDI